MPAIPEPLVIIPWLNEHMPPVLQQMGPLELLWWQWLGLPIVVVIGLLLGFVVSRVILGILGQVAARTGATWDNDLVKNLRGPVRLWWTAALTKPASLPLGLHLEAREVLNQCLVATATIALFWGVLRGIDIAATAASTSSWATRSSSSKTLIPLGRRFTKLILAALAVASALSVFGVPVASIVAGLGVGGLAVALAAQKSFENLLGAFAIGVDQPFREGDTIKIDDVIGSVEEVGLRSSRIRTPDRTIVTIPNGQLAEKRIETLAARDRLRLYSVIGLDYDTRPAQMRAVLAGIAQMLREEPKVWENDVAARMISFGKSSLDIEVQCWLTTTDWGEFSTLRTRIFLQIMDIIENAGVAFAAESRVQLLPPVNEPATARAASPVIPALPSTTAPTTTPTSTQQSREPPADQ